MSTLTPKTREQEVTRTAMWEGLVNGTMTLVPCLGAVYVAMRNEAFVRRTNSQSRTAMVIMPALFVFALTSEQTHLHKMREIAEENKHGEKTIQWAELQHQQTKRVREMTDQQSEDHLMHLYQQAVEQSGVNIVPGDKLRLHHKVANWVQANPIKSLGGLALPAVAAIFYGRKGQQHLEFSHMLLHTRVFGQFATLSILLSVMGFKDYMDKNGRYITQSEADGRVERMQQVRGKLQERLNQDSAARQKHHDDIKKAHDEDQAEHQGRRNGKKTSKKKKKEAAAAEKEEDESSDE